MNSKIDFQKFVELAISSAEKKHLRPIIEKEILHYDILFCLKESGFLEKITFQGGTSLRLCYGGYRFSEDLDFAGGKSFKLNDMISIKSCIEEYLSERYQLPVFVQEPEEITEQDHQIHVHKWQIKITTAPERKDLPKQLIKIKVANVEAYSSEPKFLQMNYNFLPDGYQDIIVMVESLNEIMTDKIVAFINTEQYVRYRDIWDLHWIKQQGAMFQEEWLSKKIRDYRIDHFQEKLEKMKLRLPDLIEGDVFLREINRFLPIDIQNRTIKNPLFRKALLDQLITIFNRI